MAHIKVTAVTEMAIACDLFSLTLSVNMMVVLGEDITITTCLRLNGNLLESVNRFSYLCSSLQGRVAEESTLTC